MENKSLVNQILHNQKVTEYGYDGYGIVRINNNYPILVENALKDEIVDVQVIQQNAKFALGKVVTQHVKSEKKNRCRKQRISLFLQCTIDNNFIWRSIEVQNTSY